MRSFLCSLLAALILGLALAPGARAQSTPAFGGRLGVSDGVDSWYLGLQTEFGKRLGDARIAPSLDFGLGDGSNAKLLNVDMRWYLLPVPETGMRIYGAVGPTIVFASDDDIGLSLSAGLNIPAKGKRRYNLEFRFGWGDVPEVKIGGTVLFGF